MKAAEPCSDRDAPVNARLALNAVTVRVFPLKASMNQLQDFCDNYLNFMDDREANRPTHYFKPAMPWVYCEVVNYGQMSTATQNVGWIAQHEVFFLVPLAWYVIENGELVFKDWAMVCPFVFVDNDISLTKGREVYGWVKVRAWLDRLDPNWADDPSNPRVLLDMRTRLFPRAYAGEPLQPRTLMQITENPPPSVFRHPFGKQDMFGPAWSIPQALRTSVGFVRDAFELVTGLPLQGYDARSIPTTISMQARNLTDLNRFLPWIQARRDTMRQAHARAQGSARNYYLNQITLKQFRDAAQPRYTCYQALVNSRITVDHFYDGGLLGASNVALGDLTGGIRLLLHDYPEQRIQSTLGLEVAEWRQAEDNTRVAVLVPKFPFWASYDLRYDNGDTLCWRTKTSDWHCDAKAKPPRTKFQGNRFNSTRGAAIQEQFGAFINPDVTVRVFPLKADKAKLEEYCEKHFNELGESQSIIGDPPSINGHRFTPWGEHVYMLVITPSDEESVSYSEHNNVGPTAGDQIVFYVPVKWYHMAPRPLGSTPFSADPDAHLFKLGVLVPYVFGTDRQVVSDREVNGVPSLHGTIEGGQDAWLNTFRGKEKSVLARLTSTFITALDVGQPAREETVIEIVDVPPRLLEAIESELAQGWVVLLGKLIACAYRWLLFLIRRVSCFLNRLLFGNSGPHPGFLKYVAKPLNCVSLKRVPSTATEAGKPSAHPFGYQALVLVQKRVQRLFESKWVDAKDWGCHRFVERLSENIRVDIHYHEALDIAGDLGLEGAKVTSSPGSAPILELRPDEPFTFRLQLREEIGCNVTTKVQVHPWIDDVTVLDDEDASGRCDLKPPDATQLAELKGCASDTPQKMISRYLETYARPKPCFRRF
jgi:hypothetical protein